MKVKKIFSEEQIERRAKDGLKPVSMKKIEFLKIPCEKGYNKIVVFRHGKKIFDESVYLSSGQVRRIRL